MASSLACSSAVSDGSRPRLVESPHLPTAAPASLWRGLVESRLAVFYRTFSTAADEEVARCARAHMVRVSSVALARLTPAQRKALHQLGPLQSVKCTEQCWEVTPLDCPRPKTLPFFLFPATSLFLDCWAFWSILSVRMDCLVQLHHDKNNVSVLLDVDKCALYKDIASVEMMLLGRL